MTKLRKYYVIFVHILQGKVGKTEKKKRKSRIRQWPKYQNPKDKIWDEQNIRFVVTQYGQILIYFVF